jgi:hypothetical protein
MYSTCSTIRSGAGLDSGCERTRRCGRSSCHSSRTSWRVRNKGRKYATRVRYTSCPHNHSALSLPRVRTRIVERASRVHPLGSTRCTSTAALISRNKIDAIPLFIGFADSKRHHLFHRTCRLMPRIVGPLQPGALHPAHSAFICISLCEVSPRSSLRGPQLTGAHLRPSVLGWLSPSFGAIIMLGESVRRGYTYPSSLSSLTPIDPRTLTATRADEFCANMP